MRQKSITQSTSGSVIVTELSAMLELRTIFGLLAGLNAICCSVVESDECKTQMRHEL